MVALLFSSWQFNTPSFNNNITHQVHIFVNLKSVTFSESSLISIRHTGEFGRQIMNVLIVSNIEGVSGYVHRRTRAVVNGLAKLFSILNLAGFRYSSGVSCCTVVTCIHRKASPARKHTVNSSCSRCNIGKIHHRTNHWVFVKVHTHCVGERRNRSTHALQYRIAHSFYRTSGDSGILRNAVSQTLHKIETIQLRFL